MVLPKLSLGIGDRFGQEGIAQIASFISAQKTSGITVCPVWNKSYREHRIIGSDPLSTREEADRAVRETGWSDPYFMDADHINPDTVGPFLPYADYFTLDVADAIGRSPSQDRIKASISKHEGFTKESIPLEGLKTPLKLSESDLRDFGGKYLVAIDQAAETYRLIEGTKGRGNFITEVSMDETDTPQTAGELLLILAELADLGVPVQAIAPKFIGNFYKGVDYVGDIEEFSREFMADLSAVAYAVNAFDLPKDLKLSVHTGSDKFSIYGPMYDALVEFDAGLHLKTAGTTWLEEAIGLAEAGGRGLETVKEIYRIAYERVEELCGPYGAVIDIERTALSEPGEVEDWAPERFADALRHEPSNAHYDRNLRQLMHLGFKIAAEMGERFLGSLQEFKEIIGKNVTENLLERHIKPLFLGASRAG